jgi:hypothetical protein
MGYRNPKILRPRLEGNPSQFHCPPSSKRGTSPAKARQMWRVAGCGWPKTRGESFKLCAEQRSRHRARARASARLCRQCQCPSPLVRNARAARERERNEVIACCMFVVPVDVGPGVSGSLNESSAPSRPLHSWVKTRPSRGESGDWGWWRPGEQVPIVAQCCSTSGAPSFLETGPCQGPLVCRPVSPGSRSPWCSRRPRPPMPAT